MRTTALPALLFLPLVGCLAGATATGGGDLIITEYGDFGAGAGGPTTYVEIGNPTAMSVDLSEYSIGMLETSGFNDFAPSTPLTGQLAAGEVFVVELAGGDFGSLFGRSPSLQLGSVNDFGSTPDAIYLYLADGSGFNGASESRNDATFQDVVTETGGLSLRNTHICRRQGVPRGRGRYDPSEWIETDVFFSDSGEANSIASVFSMDCP